MPENTQTGGTATSPTGYGWCSWHRAFSNTVRLIQVIEQGSGASPALFACSSCRDIYRLTPIADQL